MRGEKCAFLGVAVTEDRSDQEAEPGVCEQLKRRHVNWMQHELKSDKAEL